MAIIKETIVKLSYPVTLDEAKTQLRIRPEILDDDIYIGELIKSACFMAENYIEKDLAETQIDFENDDFTGNQIVFNRSFLRSVDTVEVNGTPLTPPTYIVQELFQKFLIAFDQTYTNVSLRVTYKTGFIRSDIPLGMWNGILFKITDLYDVQRGTFATSAVKQTQAFENAFDHYRLIYF